MKSMLYISLFWKLHRDYKENIRIKKEKENELIYHKELNCKKHFNVYLKYLETKNVKINNYISIENVLN
tara:strand:+ start:1505 stop:1711 length:207 start_codon:yes stop_codon:yes gene_type:complete